MLNVMKILLKKILSFKLVIISEYQNFKRKIAKEYTQYWSDEVFIISKIKNKVPWTYDITDLNGEKVDVLWTRIAKKVSENSE